MSSTTTAQFLNPARFSSRKESPPHLQKLVDAESAAEGNRAQGVRAARDCFYTGEVAEIIAECSESVGGILDMDSLADFEAKYESPIKISFLGHEIHGQRTWTQGAVLMQALNILENFDLRAMGHNSTAYIHTVSQALNLAFADRQAYYGDPDFADRADRRPSLQRLRTRTRGDDRSEQSLCGDTSAWRPVETLPPS